MPEPSLADRSGLLTTESAPVPLTGVVVDAEISSFCARVSVTQRYVNTETAPIEAVYVFPLDEGAAICGFEAIIDGTLVVGEVKEREEAFRNYDDAMEQGHGAFLLDEERPDIFQASVGNLPPGKEVLLRLTYVTELAVEGTGLRFAIPTTVSPRYAPAQDQAGIGRPDSEALNPPVAWRVPYGLDLSVRLAMAGAITRVESPSHPVAVSMAGNEATVTLSQREASLDRDFVLAVEATGLDSPRAWIERDDDGGESIAVAFAPKLPETSIPAEVIFLVDRSGSMEGISIEEVRNALQLCLRSITAGCRFNIIGFGTSRQALFGESKPYDEQSLAEASAHVAAMAADLGGTELLPALELALAGRRSSGLPRQIVVLTDGEVTNTDAVIALAKQHASEARVFTFGIGAGSSHHLVKGLARAGGGVAEFIYPGERIEPKVVRLVGRLLSPSLTNVHIGWAGLAVTQAPSTVPQVFAGGRLLVYGLAKRQGAVGGPAKVRLTADSPAGAVSFEVPVDPARAAVGRTVATLAARARIRELEESPEWAATRGSRQVHRKPNAATSEIITLAIKYGLMSRETSYVAIERREAPVAGNVQLRRVPTMLTDGWGGVRAAGIFGRAMRPGLIPAAHPQMFLRLPEPGAARARAHLDTSADFLDSAFLRVEPSMPPRAEPPSGTRARSNRNAAPAPPPAMHALVALQRADGSWDLTAELADIIGRPLNDLESMFSGTTGDEENARRAWATALALVWLRTHARDMEDEWKLLSAKGRKWLDDVDAVPAGAGAWVDAAARFLRA